MHASLLDLYRSKESSYWSRILSRAGDSASRRWAAVSKMMFRTKTAATHDLTPDMFLDYFGSAVNKDFESKAKDLGYNYGQDQGQGLDLSRPRPRPIKDLHIKAKAKD